MGVIGHFKKMNYQENINLIVTKEYISRNDIFDFTDLETEDFYLKYYNKFSKLLEENCKISSLTSIYFFFENSKLSNAVAESKNRNRYIKISNALILSLHNNLFVKSKKIFQNQKISTLYKSLLTEIDLSELMLESAINFIFYHEFRHILQHEEREFNFEEKRSECKVFDFNRHLYEYDSDLFGAWYVMDNAFTTFKKLNDKNKTPENLSKLFYVSISSIIIVLLLFYYDKIDEKLIEKEIEKFYTKKNKHPHTLVRISYIIEHFYQNIESNYKKIDLVNVMKYSFEITNAFFDDDKFVREYLILFAEEWENINCYLKILADGFSSNEVILNTIEKYKNALQ